MHLPLSLLQMFPFLKTIAFWFWQTAPGDQLSLWALLLKMQPFYFPCTTPSAFPKLECRDWEGGQLSPCPYCLSPTLWGRPLKQAGVAWAAGSLRAVLASFCSPERNSASFISWTGLLFEKFTPSSQIPKLFQIKEAPLKVERVCVFASPTQIKSC